MIRRTKAIDAKPLLYGYVPLNLMFGHRRENPADTPIRWNTAYSGKGGLCVGTSLMKLDAHFSRNKIDFRNSR